MKPPPFEYVAASSAADVVEALRRYGDDAKVLAGGQSLIPMLALRLARPSALIDINGCSDLDGLAESGGTLTVGALDTHGTAKRSDDTLASWSSKGPTMFDGLIKPDLAAPGNKIVSAEAAGSSLVIPGEGQKNVTQIARFSLRSANSAVAPHQRPEQRGDGHGQRNAQGGDGEQCAGKRREKRHWHEILALLEPARGLDRPGQAQQHHHQQDQAEPALARLGQALPEARHEPAPGPRALRSGRR